MNDNVYIVRLTTGEELLCKIKKDGNSILSVTEPVLLIPTGDGKITFMPYMAYCEIDVLPIKVEHIMFIVTPEDGLITKYKTMIGNARAIKVPEQKIIV